ncbi:MAG: hypothetical protein ACOYL0_09790 [Limnohabitans sp.]|nr:hypothetical protein [Burkholderiales bacterium]
MACVPLRGIVEVLRAAPFDPDQALMRRMTKCIAQYGSDKPLQLGKHR